MATLVDNFVNLYFNKIKDKITKGTKEQAEKEGLEWYKYKPRKGTPYYHQWNVTASDSDILECIRSFFHLCLNASKVGDEHTRIKQWIEDLMKIACMPTLVNVISSYQYSKLIGASEQITKFLFGCFDWNIAESLEGFDSRIRYYKDCCENEDIKYGTHQLLFSIKTERNDEAHKAAEGFWKEREKAIKRLYYSLFDYITVFYMILNACRDIENGHEIKLKQDVRERTQMPDSFLTINVNIDCIDASCSKSVPERKSDLRLYRIDKCGYETAVEVEVDSETPGKFPVKFFEEYFIRIVTDGIESEPSEHFTIDKDFIDGITIKVNIPPKTLVPQKISISEIVLSDQELPENVKLILDSIKEYVCEDSEFTEIARLLTIAATTKNEANRKAFEDAVKNMKVSIEQQKKGNEPIDIRIKLQEQIKNIQNSLSSAYKEGDAYKEDFLKLCENIDNLYACFDNSGYDDNTTNIDQLVQNSEALVDGKRFSYATAATDESIKQQRQLTELKLFLQMKNKGLYPEIFEVEVPDLSERIEQLFVDQINFYMEFTNPLRNNVKKLYELLKSNVELHQSSEKKALKCARLTISFLNDTPDNVIRIVNLCSGMIRFWIDQCDSVDKTVCRYKELCIEGIHQLKDRNLLIPMIYVENDNERQKIKHAYDIISRCVDDLSDINEREPLMDKTDILSEMRFRGLKELVSSCTPESFMQLVCCSSHAKHEIYRLFDILWSNQHHKEIERIKSLYHCCTRVIGILWKLFSMHERRRQGDEYWSTTVELNGAKALLIVEYLQQQILRIYGNNIPQFISDIMYASDKILPNHAKAMLLREAAVSDRSDIERLLYVMHGVLRYFGYSSSNARPLLDKYIVGDYSKQMFSKKMFDKFQRMPRLSQMLYLEILMNKEHKIALLDTSTRYMMACKLNFANGGHGNEIIDQHTFFLMMSVLRESRKDSDVIYPNDYQGFVNLANVVILVAQFSNEHPDEETLNRCSADQLRWFFNLCSKYKHEHLEVRPIKEGEYKLKFLHNVYHHKILKGLPLHEQLVAKYEYLYNDNIPQSERYTSGWYKIEKELFDAIISQMGSMPPECQQKISRKLIYILLYKMLYHDIQAERYMALKPFCKKEEFRDLLIDFHDRCERKLIIRNSPDGLNEIRELFSKEDIKTISWMPEDGKPTDFVDILITINKTLSDLIALAKARGII